MDKKIFIVENGGFRLDIFLASLMKDRSRTLLRKLIDGKCVLVNGLYKSASYIVKSNDKVEVSFPALGGTDNVLVPWNFALDVIHEENDFLIINKPPFVSVHPASFRDSKTIVNALLYHFRGKLSSLNPLKPGIVHRLDKNTSGCLLVAKNNTSHSYLSAQFKDRKVKKKYIALLHGILKPEQGTIEAPLGRSYRDRQKISIHTFRGRHAVTHYQVIKYFENYTLLRVFLETGRTHQIRVHFASIGYPIIGDDLYGNRNVNRLFKDSHGLERQFLHAEKLSFYDKSGKFREFTAPLYPDLKKVLDLL